MVATGCCILTLNDYSSQEHFTILIPKYHYHKALNGSCLPGHEPLIVHAVIFVCNLPCSSLQLSLLYADIYTFLQAEAVPANSGPRDSFTIPRCPRLFSIVMFMLHWEFCSVMLLHIAPRTITVFEYSESNYTLALAASSRVGASRVFLPIS